MAYEKWMSAADAMIWYVEQDPVLRSTITMVWTLEGAPDPDRFRREIEHAVSVVPRLRQKVLADPVNLAPPRWVDDPAFTIDDHVQITRLAADTTHADVLGKAGAIQSAPFDRSRPLWETHLFTGTADVGAVLVMKIHHAIADGMGLVRLTNSLLRRSPEETSDPAEFTLDDEFESLTTGKVLLDAMGRRLRNDAAFNLRLGSAYLRRLGSAMRDPFGVTRSTVDTGRSVAHIMKPASKALSPVMVDRSQAFRLTGLRRRLDDMKAVAETNGATVNDVFIAGVLGGLQRYHAQAGKEAESLRISMPVSVRPRGDKTAGNQFVPARFLVPANIRDPRERLAALSTLLHREKNEPGLTLFKEISEVIARVGPTAATGIAGGMMKAVDFTASNVPGAPFTVYMGGKKVTRMMPFGPCAGAAVNFTMVSYDGMAEIGINSDRAAVPDNDVLTQLVGEGFDEVIACR